MPMVIKTRPTSASNNKEINSRGSPIISENPTFCLSGSQVNLTPRLNSNAGKASVRSNAVAPRRKRRPMSAIPLTSHQTAKNIPRKPRPMSADLEKYMSQRHSMSPSEQPWQYFDTIVVQSSNLTEVKPHNMWGLNDQATPDLKQQRETLEIQTDALLDQLLESTVQQTKKQLRFAQTESNLLTLNLPNELISSDFSNPMEKFVGTLVDDIKCQVKESFHLNEETPTCNLVLESKSDDNAPSQKLLVKQLLLNNNSQHSNVEAEENEINVKKQRKPKTIAELLEIIDSEIPIQFRKKPTLPPKPKLKDLPKYHAEMPSTEVTVVPLKTQNFTPENASEYHTMEKEKAGEEEGKKNNQIMKCDDKQQETSQEEKTKEPGAASTPHSLSDILNFLDQVEKTDDMSRTCSRADRRQFLQTNEELQYSGGNTQRQMRALKDALEERSAHVQLLKESLLQARVEASDALAAANKEHRATQRRQKADFETSVKKLQDNVDKLLADKKQLVEKVEELVQQLRNVESKHQTSIHALQQRHTVEIARTKQLAAAAEKIRRERWVERQTARIKELTVKGLEPELTRLSLQHENKVAQLQAVHARELQAQAEAEARHMEELRSLMIKEKDEELARERTLLTERFERQLCEERVMLELRCERLKEEHASEVSRLQSAWSVQREALEAQARQEAMRVKDVHEQHIAKLEEKKQIEIKAAREEMETEQQSWLSSQTRKNTEFISAKQQELRDERDAEIERAIERLECEERRERAEQERETEKKLTRLREQHAAILADRDLAEKLLQARLMDAQQALQTSEEQLLAAKAAESRLKQEFCISNQRVEALEADHANIRDKISQQFEEKIAELDKSIEQLKKERDAELEQVHLKVKGVLEKKDQHIQQLRDQESDLAKRCRHLETLLGHKPLSL